MKRCAICGEEMYNGLSCHSACLHTLKDTADIKKLPAGAWCSFDPASRTISITVPRGIMTIVTTRRRKKAVK